MPDLMPTLFLGHGNPMNALAKNNYTAAWAAIGAFFETLRRGEVPDHA